MTTFKLAILSPERPFFEGEAESLTVPVHDGEMGILANHSNLISAVVPGILRYREPGGEEVLAVVSTGMVKVENNHVSVLVDTAERPEEIDFNRAERAKKEAEEALKKKQSRQEYIQAQIELSRAINRMNSSKYIK